ncbi:MAG: NAD(P)-dependent oxidoreductase [Pseudomonadota bacterium]|nr:NAD(P)-dependent oxidoreductase [Pseudomonadota bacterium]
MNRSKQTMRVGFIGLGRLGHGMAERILQSGYDLRVYDQVAEATTRFKESGVSVAASLSEVSEDRDVVITMLPTDEALEEVVSGDGGLTETMSKKVIHMAMGTHGIECIRSITQAHQNTNQTFVAGHVLGRPDMAASGTLTIVPGGPGQALKRLSPLFEVLGQRTFEIDGEPQSATAVKIAHNFVLGSAIEALGEGMALVRKLGVEPSLFYQVLTEGLFSGTAHQVYGKIIAEETYESVGASVDIGLKDANLALQAGETAKVPLPSANVWRDRLLGAMAHGDGECDWAVMAREQARASGLK